MRFYDLVRPAFFFNDTAPTEIYTLSLHDALPISPRDSARDSPPAAGACRPTPTSGPTARRDRKSTRLNSSHVSTSYAVCCLQKTNASVLEAALSPRREHAAVRRWVCSVG